MSDVTRIVALDIENVKRVQVVHLEPSPTGLTAIGGQNRQGKTSILDAICFGLGGEKYRPTNLKRDGAMADPRIEITLSNGLVVERKGKNSALKVTDPTGKRAGQKILDELVEELALDQPKFQRMNSNEKADVLLQILGIGPQLKALDEEERKHCQERETFGRIADQKYKYYKEMPWHPDVPEIPLSASELVKTSQSILTRNAEREQARKSISKIAAELDKSKAKQESAALRVKELQNMLADAEKACDSAVESTASWAREHETALLVPVDPDESTEAIEQQIAEMEAINAKVRANLDKQKANDDAESCKARYAELTELVESVRTKRRALLEGANLPLPGLAVENGELIYNGKAWDCMSGAERIRVGAAIVRKLNPKCGFILLDELEKLDMAELEKLNEWLTAEGLQAIATRVSSGDECSIIISDGLVVRETKGTANAVETTVEKEW